jgi:hypothetical protein
LAFSRSFLRRARFAPLFFAAGMGVSVVATTSPARALDTEVNATSAAQSYSLSSPWGNVEVKRRRFLQTLGLGLYHLEGGDPVPGGPELSVKIRLRLDADAGIKSDETTYDPASDRFVPGLAIAPIDLMYGYVEGRNLAKGWLGFRLGRQYVTDSLGWWSFDGGLVRITTPVYVEAELYGGLEQRGGLPLSTPRFERNGVWRGDRGKIDPTVYTQFESATIAPAYGIAIQSSGSNWIHGRLDYRKVMNTGNSTVSLLVPDPVVGGLAVYNQTRTSSDRLGYALDAIAPNLGGLKGGLVYDLFNKFFSTYYGALDVFASSRITLGGEYEYFRPTFDGDSIFNFFPHNPMTTITGRLAIDASDQFDIAGSGGIRKYTTDGNPTSFYDATGAQDRTQTSQTDVLANLGARYRYGTGMFGLRGMSQTGDRGHRQGGDLNTEQYFLARRWTALARVSVYDWADNIRPDRNATSIGYVLGGAFRPSPVVEAMLEWEHDMNRIVGQRFRILALVNLTVGK